MREGWTETRAPSHSFSRQTLLTQVFPHMRCLGEETVGRRSGAACLRQTEGSGWGAAEREPGIRAWSPLHGLLTLIKSFNPSLWASVSKSEPWKKGGYFQGWF